MHITDKYFANPAALPTMPELAVRLMRSLDRDDISLGEIASLIERDPSLAAKVLRLANSARYSPQHDIASLRDAATMLGLRSLRDISLTACLVNLFPAHVDFDRERFWRHGLATAELSRILAVACGLDPDGAYLAGLLLRTGRILMLMVEPALVAQTDTLATSPDTLMGHERTLLGGTHADVSAELARRWHFPTELVGALAAANAPLEAQPFSPLGAVIRLASTLADAGDLGVPECETLMALHPLAIHQLGLDEAYLSIHVPPFETLTLGADQLLL